MHELLARVIFLEVAKTSEQPLNRATPDSRRDGGRQPKPSGVAVGKHAGADARRPEEGEKERISAGR